MAQAGSASAIRFVKMCLVPHAVVLLLAAVALLPGLGSSCRLTYHEAFVGQGAREILETGDWGSATIGGRPWLEKPPLPWWLAAASGWCAGGMTEAAARFPSAIAAMLLALGVSLIASRHFGPTVGLLSGAIQATSAWSVMRGRLAEADIVLATLLAWTILAFDRIRESDAADARELRTWRLVFFGLLGATSLVKGIGFGAALILATIGLILLWDRDLATLRRLRWPLGWGLALAIALAWPIAMIVRHGRGAFDLWTLHVVDRLASRPEQFAGESWWQYGLGIVIQALPWAPLAFAGAWRSLGRGLMSPGRNQGGPSIDRLLWAWAVAPLLLLSLATVKNAHYAIYAQIPWSIWGALGVLKGVERLRGRGWSLRHLRLGTAWGFVAIAAAWGLGFWWIAPGRDRRGVEWAFYESAGRSLPPGEPVAFLYDDWDRNPYPTPFGPIPHDLAVRLYYLNRPACWHFDPASLGGSEECPHAVSSEGLAVIGRDRDRPALERLGRLEILANGPPVRFDRTYLLMRIHPETETAQR